ncbi:hypothetical protein DsansV1_C14g0129681 [Dioscorea sansibarensis]
MMLRTRRSKMRWVNDLKDLMYDADDIIDLCKIRGTGLLQDDDHHSPVDQSSTTTSTRHCQKPHDDRENNRLSAGSSLFSNSVKSLMMITSSCIWSAALKHWRDVSLGLFTLVVPPASTCLVSYPEDRSMYLKHTKEPYSYETNLFLKT